jgi:N-hydroxyarylamine O-acetyltransferase
MIIVERLPDDVAHAYLELLAVEVRPGAVDGPALFALQRAHVERVPYETLDIVRGRPPGIAPLATARRILAGRGGYCYHLNGAFAALLTWLGVEVTRHLAGVQGRTMTEPRGADGNHLGLTARTPDGQVWLVDVGLGDGPAQPLPLVAGVHEQDGYRYELARSACVADGWRFEHDSRGGFVGFDLAPHPAVTADFEAMHRVLSTESPFAQVATAQRRVGSRLEILRGCVYAEVSPDGVDEVDVTEPGDWWEVVLGRFGLGYGDLNRAERDELWDRVRTQHDVWDVSGRR